MSAAVTIHAAGGGQHRDRCQDRTRTGDEHQTEAHPEQPTVALPTQSHHRDPREGSFERMAESGNEQAEPDHDQQKQADRAQDVVGQAKRADERAPRQREHGETGHQPADHDVRSPARWPLPGSPRRSGEDHRKNRKHARGKPRDDAGQEAEDHDHTDDSERRPCRIGPSPTCPRDTIPSCRPCLTLSC